MIISNMATKKTIVMLLLSLLVIVMACANLDEDLRDCTKICVPVCMRDNIGAPQAVCERGSRTLCQWIIKNQDQPGFPVSVGLLKRSMSKSNSAK
jgi:hypothetical protein